MRLEIGGFTMTTRVRTLLAVAVITGACSIATAAHGAEDICAGVPAKERAMGLLAFRENIVSVTPLNEFRSPSRAAGLARHAHSLPCAGGVERSQTRRRHSVQPRTRCAHAIPQAAVFLAQ